MTHLKYLIPALLVFPLVLLNCKKQKKEDPAVNVLCDGNGSAVVFPIHKSNVWRYSHKKDGVAQSGEAVMMFGTEVKLNSKWYQTYYDSAELMIGGDHYYRIDSSNGDIYYYSPGYTEVMEMPADPAMDQEWWYLFSKRKVTNMNASIQTADCSYSGLIEVTQTDGTTVKQIRYYKKGLGLVYRITYGLGESHFALKKVSLN